MSTSDKSCSALAQFEIEAKQAIELLKAARKLPRSATAATAAEAADRGLVAACERIRRLYRLSHPEDLAFCFLLLDSGASVECVHLYLLRVSEWRSRLDSSDPDRP
jgi:hypothetical protein